MRRDAHHLLRIRQCSWVLARARTTRLRLRPAPESFARDRLEQDRQSDSLIGPARPTAPSRETAMSDQNDQQEQGLERRYTVRQVTNIQASWTEQGRGEEGKFTLQLILDNGA